MKLRAGRSVGMRRYVAVLLAAPALTACGTSMAASASSRPSAPARCGPASATTLAASRVARVYVSQQFAFGCAFGAGKSYRLGGRGACLAAPRVDPVVLAGPFAAYGVTTCGTDTAHSQVLVRNLDNGKLVMSDNAISGGVPPESFQGVKTVVIKPDGAVAWLTGFGAVGLSGSHYQVVRVDRRGHAVLDTGTGIGPESLRLQGSTVSWTDGGRTRSATLA
jgi:hypothetical protein